jgi:hypothetical protein
MVTVQPGWSFWIWRSSHAWLICPELSGQRICG